MSDSAALSNCQFCSVISKANGEDPIGTAGTYDAFLLIEAKLPWSGAIWLEAGAMPQQVVDALQQAWDRGLNFRPLAIAPDREDAQPKSVRVMFYQRPAKQFAQFERQEFIIPVTQLGTLVMAILNQPNDLPQFASYQQTGTVRDLLVCTHGNYDVACSRFGYPIYQQLRKSYAAGDHLRVWRCSHFGGHEFAPTLIDLPTGQYWGHLEPNILDRLINRDEDVTALRSFYRGWAGLTKFEQMVEREIFMQVGWQWLTYLKSGQVLTLDEANADWAEVQIDFALPAGQQDLRRSELFHPATGSYIARVESSSQILKTWDSGHDQPLEAVKQYRVSGLKRRT